jgi:hypothetical protein
MDRLPPESATKTAIRDSFTDAELAAYQDAHPTEGHGPLSRSDLVLFDIFDQLKWLEYAAYASQGAKPPHPSPRPRPGVVDSSEDTKTRALDASGVAFLTDIRARRGE